MMSSFVTNVPEYVMLIAQELVYIAKEISIEAP